MLGNETILCSIVTTIHDDCHLMNIARGTALDDFSGQFFLIFKINLFFIVVAIYDQVHDVEAIFHLP